MAPKKQRHPYLILENAMFRPDIESQGGCLSYGIDPVLLYIRLPTKSPWDWKEGLYAHEPVTQDSVPAVPALRQAEGWFDHR